MIKINEMRYSIISLITIALIFFMSPIAFSDHDKSSLSTISPSLDEIIKNKDFTDLLLFISLFDSQNIPLDLLYTYKDKAIVDKFIDRLKRSSCVKLISKDNTISLNRSAHDNIKLYIDHKIIIDDDQQKRISFAIAVNSLKNYLSHLNDADNE